MATNPLRFGPILWPWIHLQCKRLDAMRVEDRKLIEQKLPPKYASKRTALRDWLNRLDAFVPCDDCERNFGKFTDADPLPEDDDNFEHTTQFWEWSVRAHNHTNELTGKSPSTIEDAEAAFQKYWLSPPTQLNEYQLARAQDQEKLAKAESELHQLQQQHARDTITNVTMMVICAVVLILAFLICGWIIWKGGQRSVIKTQPVV